MSIATEHANVHLPWKLGSAHNVFATEHATEQGQTLQGDVLP
jgi:hypothetical protein